MKPCFHFTFSLTFTLATNNTIPRVSLKSSEGKHSLPWTVLFPRHTKQRNILFYLLCTWSKALIWHAYCSCCCCHSWDKYQREPGGGISILKHSVMIFHSTSCGFSTENIQSHGNWVSCWVKSPEHRGFEKPRTQRLINSVENCLRGHLTSRELRLNEQSTIREASMCMSF